MSNFKTVIREDGSWVRTTEVDGVKLRVGGVLGQGPTAFSVKTPNMILSDRTSSEDMIKRLPGILGAAFLAVQPG